MDPENNNPAPTPDSLNPAAAAAPNINELFDPTLSTAGMPEAPATPAAPAPAPAPAPAAPVISAAPELSAAAEDLAMSLESGISLDNDAPATPATLATDPLVAASAPAPAPAPTPAAPASIFGAAPAFTTPASVPAPAPTPEMPEAAPAIPTAEAPVAEPVAEESESANDEPLKPAAPVPGSIGSAQSYSDIEAAEAAAAAKAANPKAKIQLSKTTIIMLAVLGVVLVIIAIIAISMINGGGKKTTTSSSNNVGNTPITPAVINTKNLICSREASAEEIASLSAVAADTTITVEYEDDAMTTFTEVTNATYADHLAAEGGKAIITESYTAALALNGLATDPFHSTYVIIDTNGNDGSAAAGVVENPDEVPDSTEEVIDTNTTVDNPDGNIVRATHMATTTTLDVSSAVMFGLETADDGEVDTDLSSIEKAYATRGYTCQAQ